MSEPDLFDQLPYAGAAPFQAHSQTSKAAAEKIRKKIGPLHKRVIDYLARTGGSTDEQMMDGLELGGNTLRPRRRELQLLEIVADSGKVRLTRSNRSAVIWHLNRRPPDDMGMPSDLPVPL